MSDPEFIGGPRYRLLLAASRAAIAWERLWRRFWPAAALLGVFVSIALLDILPRLPVWLHALALLAFAGALAAALADGSAGLGMPGERAARRRLELDSGLDHRPLGALIDRIAGGQGDAMAQSLWTAHLKRMAEAARALKVRLPAPGLARLDPYGLRAAVVLFLVIGFAAGGGDAASRLHGALVPQFGGWADSPVSLDMWITPPAYTGLAPLFLNSAPPRAGGGAGDPIGAGRSIEVPAGSALLAQTGGAKAAPRLTIGSTVVAFSEIGSAQGGHRVETVIEEGDRLSVEVEDRELASWPLNVLADGPPQVAFSSPPQSTAKAHLRIAYRAGDDYGLSGVSALIRRPSSTAGAGEKAEIRLTLPMVRPGAKALKSSSIHNLTAHPWAGLPVRLRLVAVDGRGQRGVSGEVELVLPERAFKHPVARAIIEQRKKLAAPSAKVRAEVIAALSSIASRPRLFAGDTAVYLGLRVAQARLVYDRGARAVASVRKLMWDTALSIEDGELSLAERALDEARERLMGALDEGADMEKVDRLMDELRQALDRYLAALGDRLDAGGEFPPLTDMLRSDDLRGLIERARDLARTGSVAAARRLLNALQRLVERIQEGLPPSRQAIEAGRLLKDLRSLSEGQQRLLDQTFRRFQESRMKAPEGDPKTAAETARQAERQDALRRRLGDLMLRFDELLDGIPRPLGKAERSMGAARDALSLDRPGEAMEAQGEAVEQLRRATEGMAERMARMLGAIGGAIGAGRGGEFGAGRDPFGRLEGGAVGTAIDGGREIPDHMEMRRAREILDELRRRSGQRRRPKVELDYIERLLDRF